MHHFFFQQKACLHELDTWTWLAWYLLLTWVVILFYEPSWVQKGPLLSNLVIKCHVMCQRYKEQQDAQCHTSYILYTQPSICWSHVRPWWGVNSIKWFVFIFSPCFACMHFYIIWRQHGISHDFVDLPIHYSIAVVVESQWKWHWHWVLVTLAGKTCCGESLPEARKKVLFA